MMNIDQVVADRVTDLALDDRIAKTDDPGAAWLDGYAQALADLDRGALPHDAQQIAKDVRMVLQMLPALYWRRDNAGIDGVFRVVKRLTHDPAFATLTRRELRLFWAVAVA